jgi:Tol biopolymer transport system component
VEKRSSEQPANIFLFSPETGERRALTSPTAPLIGDSLPAFSPDSQTVAFVRTTADVSQDVYLVSITGGEPRRLTFDNVPLSSTAWTTDGREIIFSSTREGGDYGLWRISASGGTPERAVVGGHHVPVASVSRQGNRLAYVQWSGDFNIYRIDVSDSTRPNSPPIKLTSSTRLDFNPQYSPDGKRIVFQSDRSGSSEIWMCDSDGANPVQVTSLNKIAGTPRWSPDGQQIAFDLYPDARGDIYVIRADGGPPRPIVTGDSEDHLPSWSIDGRWIYFASNRTGERQVWKVPAEGGKAVQVTKQGGEIAFESPDGRHVYYIKDSAPGIWRVSVDGGEEIQVFESFRSELFNDWAVVSDGIYFINPDAKDGVAVEFFNFATREVKLVGALGKVAIHPFGMAVSPDRRQIVYAQDDNPGGDIMLVENFR